MKKTTLFIIIYVLLLNVNLLAQDDTFGKELYSIEIGVSNYSLNAVEVPIDSIDYNERLSNFIGFKIGFSKILEKPFFNTSLRIGANYKFSGISTKKYMLSNESINTPEATISEDHHFIHSLVLSAQFEKYILNKSISVVGGLSIEYNFPENFRRRVYADFDSNDPITIRTTKLTEGIPKFNFSILGGVCFHKLSFFNNKIIPIFNFGLNAKTISSVVNGFRVKFADSDELISGRVFEIGLKFRCRIFN